MSDRVPIDRLPSSFMVEPFVDYLSLERGLSEHTVLGYVRDLTRMVDHVGEAGIGRPQDIRIGHLRAWAYRLAARGLAPSSVRRAISAVRTYLRFLIDEGVLGTDPAERLETPRAWRKLPDTLSVEDVRKLLDGVDSEDRMYWRDRGMLEVLYASGMRVSELTGLTVDAVHLDEGLCTVFGKGAKERIVPLGRSACVALDRYLTGVRPGLRGPPATRRSSDRAVFLNQRGSALSRTSVWTVVKRAAERAGLRQNVSPHTLRHSCATHLLEGGADLAVVQEVLGHADVSTTEIYTHVDRAYLRAEHQRYHPRG